jgi:hypothetical protein
MSDNQHRDQTNDPKRPSQAEGDRDTIDQALGDQASKGQRQSHAPASGVNDNRTNDPKRPSQAEGERDAAKTRK